MNKHIKLQKLKEAILSNYSLPLKDSATNLVFGEGNPDAEVFFLGEAPGRYEDLSGKPFVGQAGKVLDRLLNSIGLKRDEVFITSVLQYRPPSNRPPKNEEIKAFEPYTNKQLEIINPKVVATLGKFSLNKFLPEAKISIVHGKPQKINWNGKPLIIIPLYHPASVLYKRDLLKQMMEDFLVIKRVLKN